MRFARSSSTLSISTRGSPLILSVIAPGRFLYIGLVRVVTRFVTGSTSVTDGRPCMPDSATVGSMPMRSRSALMSSTWLSGRIVAQKLGFGFDSARP
ncbi:hypothetical protein D3C86_1763570 [compost metagenome]